MTAAVNQGAVKAALKERADDLYETPPQAVQALLRSAERLPDVIWEPAAGRGAIARELRKAGHRVVTTDLVAYDGADPGIEPRIDFLMERHPPKGCDCIITNPPYKLADAFVRHGLMLVDRVIVLLRLMALEGANRADLIDRHLVRVYAGIERLPMMHREGWVGPKIDSAGVPFAWFVFSATARLPGMPIELTRISWRDGP